MDFSNLRIVDLSVPLEHMAASEPLPAKIHYVDHADEGLAQMQQFFGVTPADLVCSGGQGWAVEEIQAITHTGAHVDAPYHYGATSEGKPARTIDHVPLEWCFAPGVVLDMRYKAAGALITVDDLSESLKRIDCTLKPLDIVLLQTGADARLGSPEYFRQPGFGRKRGCCGSSNRACASSASMPIRSIAPSPTWLPTSAARETAPYLAGPLCRPDSRILPDRKTGPFGPDRSVPRLFCVVPARQHQSGERRMVPGRRPCTELMATTASNRRIP